MMILIVIDCISHAAFLILKVIVSKKMEAVSVDEALLTEKFRSIKSEKDLKIYGKDYFIFADYVYST